MNLVFLDVDYVLNSYRKSKEVYMITGKRHSGKDFPFDEVCLKNLKNLIDRTNSYIIITSSWRKYEDHMVVLKDKLVEYDLFDRVIGMTEIIGNRICEIDKFLEGISCNYVILDDVRDMGKHNEHFICTDPFYGLVSDDIDVAMLKLTKNTI